MNVPRQSDINIFNLTIKSLSHVSLDLRISLLRTLFLEPTHIFNGVSYYFINPSRSMLMVDKEA